MLPNLACWIFKLEETVRTTKSLQNEGPFTCCPTAQNLMPLSRILKPYKFKKHRFSHEKFLCFPFKTNMQIVFFFFLNSKQINVNTYLQFQLETFIEYRKDIHSLILRGSCVLKLYVSVRKLTVLGV